jgi:hypothetical protein
MRVVRVSDAGVVRVMSNWYLAGFHHTLGFVVCDDKDGRCIATIGDKTEAQLIAAAPDLMEALQAAVDDCTGKPNAWFQKAKDALAKAAQS